MALLKPKAVMKESIATFDTIPNSCSANWGMIERSKPTMPPTKALTITKSVNCCQFSLRPNFASIMLIFLQRYGMVF
ncbi:hypothetical protein [Arcicella rosea]|uniref:hypothetical protein n=1 Tax=Arcicella rosea TaxID=502909 RepID=UPI0038D3D499